MIELRTLGHVRLSRCDGVEIQSVLAQPKRLALLVYLALAAPGQMQRRDSLLALFWPESDEERARSSLRTSLHFLRRSLGDGVIETRGADEVGLAPGSVGCDALLLEDALRGARWEEAVERYAGPLLPGFALEGTPGWEEWVDGERTRLARGYAQALEALAHTQEAAGDRTAVETWRRLAAHDPFSSRVALRLMQALEVAGERAAALQHAQTHAALLRAELDLEPEVELLALVERLRSDSAAPAPDQASGGEPTADAGATLAGTLSAAEVIGSADPLTAQTTGQMPTATAEPAPSQAAAAAGRTAGARGRWWLSRRWAGVLTAGVLLLMLAGTTATAGLWRSGVREGPPRVSVVVLPFATAAGPGMPSGPEAAALQGLLAASLELVPPIRALDGSSLLAEAEGWRSLPVPELVARARRVGARYILVGDLLADGAAPVTLVMYDAYAGTRVFRGVGAPGESVADAIQRLALEVTRDLAARERLDTEAVRYLLSASSSPVALEHFRRGQARFQAGDTDGAVESFRWAIAADSSFGLAYHRLSVAEGWSPRWDDAAALAAIEAGLTHRARMAPEWVRLLEAQRHALLRDAAEAREALQRLVAEHPRQVDAWLALGELLLHSHPGLGVKPTDALPAFERALALDSTVAPVYDHLTDLAIQRGDAERARRYVLRIPERNDRLAREVAIALRFGDAAERARALRSLPHADRRVISSLVQLFESQGPLVDTLGTYLMAPDRTPDDHLRGAQYRLIGLTAQGRWAEAVAVWRPVAGTQQFDKWIVHAYLAGHPAGELAAPMFAWARTFTDQGHAPDFTTGYAGRDPFRALVHRALLHGDSAEVGYLLDRLEAAAPQGHPSDPEPDGLRASLLARLALLAGDTARTVELLERSVRGAPWSWTSAFAPLTDAAPQRLLLARLLAAHGDRQGAERWLHSFDAPLMVGNSLYARAVADTRAGLRQSRPARAGPSGTN